MIINITHNDLDGAISNIVLSKIYRIDAVFYCSYSNLNKIIDDVIKNYDPEQIIISDISLTIPQYTRLHEKCSNILYLDHHEGSRECYEYLGRELDITKSGAGLCWEHVNNVVRYNKTDRKYLEFIVKAADAYDLWQTDNPDFKTGYKLNIVFWHYSFDEFVDNFSYPNANRQLFTPEEKKTIKYDMDTKREMIKESHKVIDGDRMIVFAPSQDITNDFSLAYKNVNEFYVITRTHDGKLKMSVRLKDDRFCVNEFVRGLRKKHPDVIITAGGHSKAGSMITNLTDYDELAELLIMNNGE